VDEPDIWARSLDDQLLLWIDVGEPAPDRIKKASRIAKEVKVPGRAIPTYDAKAYPMELQSSYPHQLADSLSLSRAKSLP